MVCRRSTFSFQTRNDEKDLVSTCMLQFICDIVSIYRPELFDFSPQVVCERPQIEASAVGL